MALALGNDERIRRGVSGHEPSAPVLVLTGTGADPADAAGLYGSVPAYRDAADACATALGRPGEAEALLAEDGAVAACCHEYALATALTAWGVAPAGLAATGTGLATAAALTGALPLADALDLARGTAPHRVDPPRLPVVSPRTGRWMTEDESRDPAAWTGPADTTASWDALLDGTGRHAVRLTPPDGEPGASPTCSPSPPTSGCSAPPSTSRPCTPAGTSAGCPCPPTASSDGGTGWSPATTASGPRRQRPGTG
ncbi:hypothetical protein HFP71_05485 [Streptomyces sp. ARC32]